jgi:hypothetical protein
VTCRYRALHALAECNCFKPDDFAALLTRERHWIKLLVTALDARSTVRSPEVKTLTDNVVSMVLQLRARQLRN